jgi:hypothetical protein
MNCKRCKRSDVEFGTYVSAAGKTYFRRTCNSCRSNYQKSRYRKDPKLAKKISDNTYRCLLLRVYKMTLEDYENLFKAQNGLCAVCQQPSKKKLNVDHCHTTGKVRGLLCWNCNIGIGKFKDNTNVLQNAITYLKHHE